MKRGYGKQFTKATLAALLICLLFAGIAVAEEAIGVKVMKKLGVGSYLADGNGMTLYTFNKDKAGKSACTGDCLTQWPVFYVKPELVVEGCEQSDFDSFVRADGAEQTTYKGKPLYYYAKDEKPGQTNGHEAAKGWKAAKN
jgi:predicted lipoprotein with Yx(FWY)xxD motif